MRLVPLPCNYVADLLEANMLLNVKNSPPPAATSTQTWSAAGLTIQTLWARSARSGR